MNIVLPQLPMRHKKQEADFGLRFRTWWEKHGIDATYELKDSRGKNYILFSEITDDQLRVATMANSDKGILIRVERGTTGTPDYIGLKNKQVFFVINYPKSFEIITLGNLVHEKETNKRKSLTYERAKAISTVSVIHR